MVARAFVSREMALLEAGVNLPGRDLFPLEGCMGAGHHAEKRGIFVLRRPDVIIMVVGILFPVLMSL
jgi:hypothetical protein